MRWRQLLRLGRSGRNSPSLNIQVRQTSLIVYLSLYAEEWSRPELTAFCSWNYCVIFKCPEPQTSVIKSKIGLVSDLRPGHTEVLQHLIFWMSTGSYINPIFFNGWAPALAARKQINYIHCFGVFSCVSLCVRQAVSTVSLVIVFECLVCCVGEHLVD